MAYQWILLDADNTLFDFDRSERHALQTALESYGVPFEEPHIERYHRINAACWRAYEKGAMTKSRLRRYRFEQFFEEIGAAVDPGSFADTYMEALAATDFLIEGARSLLHQLERRYQLVLVTNGLSEVQRPRLANTGLDAFFPIVVVSDEIGHSKPDSKFFEHTFQQIEHPPKAEVLMVGDNINADIRGGKEYGLDTCWYNPGRRPNESSIEPTYEIELLEDLSALLK